jgi:hypothetical protein
LRTSTHPDIASLILANASSFVSPCEWQPGRAGQLTVNPPSSVSGVMTTLKIIAVKGIGFAYLIIIMDEHKKEDEESGMAGLGALFG